MTTQPATPGVPARWRYGDAWERFPIEPGQVWGVGDSRVAIHDVFDPLPGFMLAAELLYVDPPWNAGNINAFYTKAGLSHIYRRYEHFVAVFFERIREINPRVCYLEMGRQHADWIYSLLPFPHRQRWPVTYYRTQPCWLFRGSLDGPVDHDFTGIDEARIPAIVARLEPAGVIGDLCMGRGLTGLAAYRAGKTFVGTELNARRLACLLAAIAKLGGHVERFS